jgi:hypothetical protein
VGALSVVDFQAGNGAEKQNKIMVLRDAAMKIWAIKWSNEKAGIQSLQV